MSFHSEIHLTIRTPSPGTNPQSVKTGVCKDYPRMPRIELSKNIEIPDTLSSVLRRRHSYANNGTDAPLSLEEVSKLLGNALAAHKGSVRRHYPSGGGLYPIETYLCGPLVENFSKAVFHYHPIAHALEHLWDQRDTFAFYNYISEKVPAGRGLIVLTAVWDRTSAKYGNLGYSHALIEAGHIAQNILLCATAMNIGARPIAGFFDEKLQELLDIDPKFEQIVYVIALAGKHA